MAQFTLKIKTYDPDIVNAFARLRKSRKQSAYTHEALKFFLTSEQGTQVMELMSKEAQPERSKPQTTRDQPRNTPPKPPEMPEQQPPQPGGPQEDYCTDILGKILR